MIFRDDGKGGKIGVDQGPANLCVIPLILMLVSFFACGSPGAESDSWDELLKRQHQELLETAKSVDRLASSLPERLPNLQKRLYLLRSRFEKIMLYFNLRSGNPLVLRDIMGVLDWFERETERLRLPLKQEKASVERLMESLTDRYHINRIFRQNNIEISFPQLDLHIRSAEGLKDPQQNNSRKT